MTKPDRRTADQIIARLVADIESGSDTELRRRTVVLVVQPVGEVAELQFVPETTAEAE